MALVHLKCAWVAREVTQQYPSCLCEKLWNWTTPAKMLSFLVLAVLETGSKTACRQNTYSDSAFDEISS